MRPSALLLDSAVAKTDADVQRDPFVVETMSNQRVLMVVTVSFTLFVCAEIVFAIAFRSLSLLGDAAAMSVDVFSYLTNMIAERIKARTNGVLDPRTHFLLEVAVPSLSISCLLGVTAWITSDAIRILMNPSAESDEGDDLNVNILYGFASANFVVDVVSFWMFYRRGSAVFMTSYEAVPSSASHASPDSLFILDDESPSSSPSQQGREREVNGSAGGGENSSSSSSSSSSNSGSSSSNHVNTANLNMISAFSHVGGDTLRTASIFIAAVVSTITGTSVSLVDAWAAAIVCGSIVFMVVPLVLEIYKAHKRMRE